MAKSNIALEDVRTFISNHAAAASIEVGETSSFLKLTSRVNKQRIYIQKSATLGRIDTTLVVNGQPGTIGLQSPNGSVNCHLEPTLENLGHFMQMLADGAVATQVIKKPRPFAPVTSGGGSAPRPVRSQQVTSPTVPVQSLKAPSNGTVTDRLQAIARAAEAARARRKAESIGDESLAQAVAEGKIDEEDVLEQNRLVTKAKLRYELSEAGLDIPEMT